MHASLAGKLLLAMPAIGDPRFDHTVILMCAHNEDHAVGIVLNRPREEITLADVLAQLGFSAQGVEGAASGVLDGGPVGQDRGFVLHSQDRAFEASTDPVAPGVRLTTSRDVLAAISAGEAPLRYVLALGYAGWDGGQLERELAMNAWLVADPDEAIVFGPDHAGKWRAALARLGLTPDQLTARGGLA